MQIKKPRQMLKFSTQTLLLASIFLFVSALQAQEWTRFRGPNGQGISAAKTIPVKWTESDYNWKVKLAGSGHSSPVVWQDTVYVTGADTQREIGYLQALSITDGKELWRKEYPYVKYRINSRNSFASSTPTVNAQGVYVLWPTAQEVLLDALTHKGKSAWRRTFPGLVSRHGGGTSPVAIGDMVIFTCENRAGANSPDSVWIALDAQTGKDRWTCRRNNPSHVSYSIPCLYPTAVSSGWRNPQLIFTSKAHGFTAIDPQTGKVIWEYKPAFKERVVSSPVIADDVILCTCGSGGYGRGLVAVRLNKNDPTQTPQKIYSMGFQDMHPYVTTSIALNGFIYMFQDLGEISCIRADTGKPIWKEKTDYKFYASPIWIHGNLYCVTRAGEVVVIKATFEKYDLLAVNPLGEMSHSTPAVAGEQMFLKTISHLISIGDK
jgi:outer membrane protein assembly factor BamB